MSSDHAEQAGAATSSALTAAGCRYLTTRQQWDCSNVDLRGLDLRGAQLYRARLDGALLQGANLSGANLTGQNLRGHNLRDTDLSGAHLIRADLSKANLSGANLRGANLTRADLSGANISGADLTGARLPPDYERVVIDTPKPPIAQPSTRRRNAKQPTADTGQTKGRATDSTDDEQTRRGGSAGSPRHLVTSTLIALAVGAAVWRFGGGVPGGVAIAVVAGITMCTVALFGYRAVRRSRLSRVVDLRSRALAALSTINDGHRRELIAPEPINLRFEFRVDTKGKFDNFDLDAAMLDEIATQENSLALTIEQHVAAAALHERYEEACKAAEQLLGSTQAAEFGQRRFDRVEVQQFARNKLRRPSSPAQVLGAVSYTSPRGRNSYRRRREWALPDIKAALVRLDTQRQTRSRIQLERDKMTPSMRVDVLRRDNYTCRMCGRSAADIELHVDHIRPVSRGGLTEMDNLQTLCRDCNLGKGNRFTG